MESVLLDAAGHRRRRRLCLVIAVAAVAQQRRAVPGRSTDGRRDRLGHALDQRASRWPPPPRADRAALRAGLRISEALALQESDLDAGRGGVLVRRGKGGKRREGGMDRGAWEQLEPATSFD